jgi:Domain of unknown function (DUF4351)
MVVLEESPWYNKILRRGEARGKADLVLRWLPRQLGPIDPDREAQIRSLSLAQLNDLSEALLDFAVMTDRTNWLMMHTST